VIDGTDEETQVLLESLLISNLRVIHLKQSVGGSEARNIGVRAARASWICFLDDDDEWLPGKLSKQIAAAQSVNATKVIVVCRYVHRREGRPDRIWPHRLRQPGERMSEFMFRACSGFQTSTFFFSKALYSEYQFKQGLLKHQDWDWMLRVSADPTVRFVIIDEPLSIYNAPVRHASVSRNLDWRYSLQWARTNRALMTSLAYSRFLVKICARSAQVETAGSGAFAEIWRELLANGRPTAPLLIQFAAAVVLPDDLRSKLADRFYRTLKIGSVKPN
jgi:glycosyltransferase involved in cell wall biosynthesis